MGECERLFCEAKCPLGGNAPAMAYRLQPVGATIVAPFLYKFALPAAFRRSMALLFRTYFVRFRNLLIILIRWYASETNKKIPVQKFACVSVG